MARPSLFTHRKFTRLSRMLGAPYKAAGVLEVIWHHSYQDGDPRLGTTEDVEFMVGWDGEPGACVAALLDAGFLDRDETGELLVHDLKDHAPDYVRKRQTREAARRTRSDDGDQRPDSDRSATGQRPPKIDTPAPAPAPTPTPMSGDGEPTSNEAVGPEPKDGSGPPPLLVFPTVGKDGHEWGLLQTHIDTLAEAFPALDILAEARKARAWIVGNPSRRKTPGGMTRFLYSWIEREQNRRGAPSGQPAERNFDADFERIAAEQTGRPRAN